MLPKGSCHRALHGRETRFHGDRGSRRRWLSAGPRAVLGRPAASLFVEGLLLGPAEGGNAIGLSLEERIIVRGAKGGLRDAQGQATQGKGPAHLEEFLVADLIEAKLVERPEEPGLFEMMPVAIAVPHLDRAADELVAPGSLHAVDTQVCAAYAHGILRSPGAGGIVFGRDQSVPRVQRRSHRGAEVDIPEAQYKVVGGQDDVLHRLLVRQAVDAANKLKVPRTPGRVVPNRLHVARGGLLGRGIVPGQGKLNDAARQRKGLAGFHRRKAGLEEVEDRFPRGVQGHPELKGTNPGGHLFDARVVLCFEPAAQRFDFDARL